MGAHPNLFLILLLAIILFGAATAVSEKAGRLIPGGLTLVALYMLLRLLGIS